jgi:type II secretory ATPase GspE/PulE/Tfp pilus assembly ATPase PilB-like protein
VALSQELRVSQELEAGLQFRALDDAPAIRAVDELFDAALSSGASDVHIEPDLDGGRVRERVDGVLRTTRRIPEALFAQILVRVKLLAGMDIADRRLPQDGGFRTTRNGRSVDARVSSMPTILGEKLALRLLDVRANVPSLEILGMPPEIAEPFRAFAHAAAGFIVVCGPTGSGKTTTAYATLAERNVEGQHVCTVEDPVEMRLNGVAQVQVNVRAGLTFPAALRALLRQDPNAVLIGELRDAETAAVASAAALSGQLIFTTLHSAGADGAVDRLLELGLSRRSIAAGLSGSLGQRLVRMLCDYCKVQGTAGTIATRRLGIADGSLIHEALGCDRCARSGFRGRTGIFELFRVSAAVRAAIGEGHPASRLAELAADAGYERMAQSARRLVLSGRTSATEADRVLSDGLS